MKRTGPAHEEGDRGRHDPEPSDPAVLRTRFEDIRSRAAAKGATAGELLDEALLQLSVALEEIEVAMEKVRQQEEERSATQILIEAERRRYRELFDFAPDAYIVTDPDGIVEEVNRAATSLLKAERQALVGKALAAHVPHEMRAEFQARLDLLRSVPRLDGWEIHLRTPDGEPVPASASVSAVRESDRRVASLRWILRDGVDRSGAEERRLLVQSEADRLRIEMAAARLRKLQAITDVMLRHLGVEELLRGLLDAVRDTLGSDTATILLLTPDGKSLAVRAVSGEGEEVRGEVRVPLGKGIAGRIAARRRPRIVNDVPKAGPYSRALRERVKSLVGVPLIVGPEAIGVVHAATYTPHVFTQEDVHLLELVAERAAVAIENAALYESEQEARRQAEEAARRTAALQSVTAALSKTVTSQQVAAVVVEQAVNALGAEAGLMAMLTEDGTEFEIVRASGYPEEQVRRWKRFPVDASLPISEAVATGRPVLLESVADREQRYPDVPAMLDLPDHATAAVPVSIEGRPLGGMALRFATRRGFGEADVEFMTALARQAGLALERARLFEAEQQARRDAEQAQLRLAFLAEAGAILSGSLEFPDALEGLARLAVTFLTDLCLIDMRQDDGSIRRMAAVHADPEKQDLADLLRSRYAPDPLSPHPAVRVIETGRSEFAADMPEDFLRRTTRDDEHYELVRRLGFQSYICVPLVPREQGPGCFTLVSCNPDRRYGPADVSLAEELARRAALAMDNAVLYEAERAARGEAERAEDRVAFLAEASEALASSLDVEVTLSSIAGLAVPQLADWCTIDLLDQDGSLRQVAVTHRDPSKEAVAKELRERYPPDREGPHTIWKVLLSGQSELATEIADDELAARARDPLHARLLRHVGIRSHMVVPLVARGRILGAISLVRGDSGRVFGHGDLILAEDLGRRAAVAIDNAGLYRAELRAREEAERAGVRLAFLSEASASLSMEVPDYHAMLERVARLAVPVVGDICVIDLLEVDGSIVRIATAHADPEKQEMVEALKRYPPDPARPHPVLTVLATGEPRIIQEVPVQMAPSLARDDEHLALLGALDASAVMIFPLWARNRTLGAISLAATGSRRAYDEDDAALARELARRASMVVDNARLYELQRNIAQTLQRSLLPASLPDVPGMELAARYRAAGEGNEVGGDFYDAFEVADGAWILTIGDVCGKGPEAAAVTGLARHTLRAVALHEPRPSRMLAILNEAILGEVGGERFCTVCCVRVRPRPRGTRLTMCSGGHPLPLILRADGTLETAGEPSMLLGILTEVELKDHAVDLEPGDTLVMFTDGVVEEPRGVGEPGSARLARVLTSSSGHDARGIADAIEATMPRQGSGSLRDDFAVLVLRVRPES